MHFPFDACAIPCILQTVRLLPHLQQTAYNFEQRSLSVPRGSPLLEKQEGYAIDCYPQSRERIRRTPVETDRNYDYIGTARV
jgi:hypothetical protein